MRLTLSELKKYLKSKSQVSLEELSKVFLESVGTIEPMICHFIHKGCVMEKRMTARCGTSCQQCQLANAVYYTWIEHSSPDEGSQASNDIRACW